MGADGSRDHADPDIVRTPRPSPTAAGRVAIPGIQARAREQIPDRHPGRLRLAGVGGAERRDPGGDASKIYSPRGQRGGDLAAVVSRHGPGQIGPTTALQVLVYPVTNHSFSSPGRRQELRSGLRAGDGGDGRWFGDHDPDNPSDGENVYASPVRAAVLTGLPPAVVLTAEYDPLRDEGEDYAMRLKQAGVPTEGAPVPGDGPRLLHPALRRGGEEGRLRRPYAKRSRPPEAGVVQPARIERSAFLPVAARRRPMEYRSWAGPASRSRGSASEPTTSALRSTKRRPCG